MEDEDPWLAVDKLEHFLACFLITILVCALARVSSRPFIRRHSVALGSIAALAAGAAKESGDEIGLWNSPGGSVRDAAADAVGVVFGASVLAYSARLMPAGRRRRDSDQDQEEVAMV